MMKRFILGLALSTAMASTACSAQESVSDQIANVANDMASIPAEAWRTVDPENLIVIDTAYGKIGVELFPEIAPAHAQRACADLPVDLPSPVLPVDLPSPVGKLGGRFLPRRQVNCRR